jgi:hypothetical protein
LIEGCDKRNKGRKRKQTWAKKEMEILAIVGKQNEPKES